MERVFEVTVYVALSYCIHPRNIKVLFPDNQEHSTNVTNVVWSEVFRNLEL